MLRFLVEDAGKKFDSCRTEFCGHADTTAQSESLDDKMIESSLYGMQLLGAIGVSGAKSEEDEEIAKAGVAALQK